MCLHIQFFGLFFSLVFFCFCCFASGPNSGSFIYIYMLHRCVVGFVVCFVCWLCLLCCCVWFWHGGVGANAFFFFVVFFVLFLVVFVLGCCDGVGMYVCICRCINL